MKCHNVCMLETSARLLRLLSLFQGRKYWSGRELADRLEVTPRTLRRDVDKLRSLGYPIHSATGLEGGYQLAAGSTMPPLLLDDEETVAVALGLRSAASGAIEGIEEASIRALAKMEQILPPRLSRRVRAMQSAIVTAGIAKSPIDAKTLSTLAAACRDREALRFRYRDHAGAVTARSVEPHRLVNLGRRWYLIAWDAGRTDWRTFRVDRIERRITTGPRFTPREPPSRDLAAYVTRGIRKAPGCRARVKLFASAESILERWPTSSEMVEPIDAESCWFEMGASSYQSLAAYFALFDLDFEVTGPPELIDEIHRLAVRLRKSVGGAQ
jgi:predicted DNA-binding transcriptional regulator YafY